jgi:hypothetical protein
MVIFVAANISIACLGPFATGGSTGLPAITRHKAGTYEVTFRTLPHPRSSTGGYSASQLAYIVLPHLRYCKYPLCLLH